MERSMLDDDVPKALEDELALGVVVVETPPS